MGLKGQLLRAVMIFKQGEIIISMMRRIRTFVWVFLRNRQIRKVLFWRFGLIVHSNFGCGLDAIFERVLEPYWSFLQTTRDAWVHSGRFSRMFSVKDLEVS